MQLALVRHEHVEWAWGVVQPMLVAAVRKCGDWSVADLFSGLMSNRLQLWVAVDAGGIAATAVTQLTDEHCGRVFWIVACGGAAKGQWRDLIAGLEKFAKAECCTRIRVSGRKGWARVFPDYHQPFITLEKAL